MIQQTDNPEPSILFFRSTDDFFLWAPHEHRPPNECRRKRLTLSRRKRAHEFETITSLECIVPTLPCHGP